MCGCIEWRGERTRQSVLTLLPSDSLHTYGLLLCSTPTLHVMPERTSGLRGSLGVCVCARTLTCVFLTGAVACVYLTRQVLASSSIFFHSFFFSSMVPHWSWSLHFVDNWPENPQSLPVSALRDWAYKHIPPLSVSMWCKHFSHWLSHLSSPQLLFPGLGLGRLVGFEGSKEIIPRKMPLCGCGSVVMFEKENTYGCQGFCVRFHSVSRGPGTRSCRKSKEEEPMNTMWAWEQWGSSVTMRGLRGKHIRSVWGKTMRALFRRPKSIPAASLNSKVT